MRIRSATFTVASFCIVAAALSLVMLLSDPEDATVGLIVFIWLGIAVLAWSFLVSFFLLLGWALSISIRIASIASVLILGMVWSHQRWYFSERLLSVIVLATLVGSWIMGWRLNRRNYHDRSSQSS